MNIYELAIEKFKNFTGEKLVVWENTEKKHKVWMEVNKNLDVYVYVLHSGKTLKPRWKIGFLSCGYNEGNVLCKYKLLNGVDVTYEKWVKKCHS